MPRNKFILTGMLLLGLIAGCIDPFSPKLTQSQRLLVVEGLLTDQEGVHGVYVSRSAPYSDPLPEAISGCMVQIVDESGDGVLLQEVEPGHYDAWIPASFLVHGRGYQLHVELPGGETYRSSLEIMPDPCPAIDSIHYRIEQVEEAESQNTYTGLQFLIDVDASSYPHRYFRWILEETWKYYARYIPDYLYEDGEVKEYPGDPYENSLCYRTLHIPELFAASTGQLSSNRLKAYPLNFVSNGSDRLKHRYSLLVRQLALSESSYTYWSQMQSQTQEGGGFYETQPAQMTGNIQNVNDPGELVLGIFDVASVSEKRVFVPGGLPLNFTNSGCGLDTITGPADFEDEEIPLHWKYLVQLGEEEFSFPYGIADNYCFDCTLRGGTTEEPDFWE